MNAPADRGSGDLRQRLEILRVQGGRHRLELAMSIEVLVNETGGIWRGLGRVLSVVGLVAGGGLRKGLLRTVLGGLVPIAVSLFAGPRTAGRMRTTLEFGALGMIIYRTIKRALRKSPPPAPAEDPPGASAADTAGAN